MLTSDLPYSSDSTSKSQPYPAGYVSEKIQIHSQPRERFRPRTKKESEGSSHYIRSDDSAQPEYPSIKAYSNFLSSFSLTSSPHCRFHQHGKISTI